jgi:hypothetical protein
MAARSPAARRLLAHACAHYSLRLAGAGVHREAAVYAEQALEIAAREFAPEWFWTAAVHVSALSAASGGGRSAPARGVAILQGWLPLADHPQWESALYRDMADYAARYGQYDTALDYIRRARAAAERTRRPALIDDACSDDLQRLGQIVHADILIEAGRPESSLALMPEGAARSPEQQFWELRRRTRALQALGASHEAHDWLQRAYGVIAAHGLEQFRSAADALARQF